MLKINLGGTCGNSKWRNELIEKLDKKIEYRNPIVKNGTWKYNKTIKLKKENDMKECDYLVYVITPKQKGFSSIASAVDYSNKVPKKVIFCILTSFILKTMPDIIKNNGGLILENLDQIAEFLNNKC